MNTDSQRRLLIADLMAAWLPSFVAFVLIPFSLYLPNQKEFDFNSGLMLPYLLVFAVCGGLGSWWLALLQEKRRGRAAVWLFCFGVYLALSDLLAPVQMGEMKRTITLEPLPEPWTKDLLDLGLGVVALVLAARLPVKLVRRIAVPVLCALLLSEAAIVGQGLLAARKLKRREAELAPLPSAPAETANIYHITFDGFSNQTFMDILRQTSLESDFEGFLFFPRNKSNYLQTYVSMPSYMTGRLYSGGKLGPWTRHAQTGGIIGALYAAGYETWQHVRPRTWIHKSACHVVLERHFRSEDFADASRFGDLWLLHLAPHYLHQEVYPVGSRGIVTRLLSRWTPASTPAAETLRHVAMMRRLIADEERRPNRGQYVYAHILIPHVPYVLDRNCRYAPDADYNSQAQAAIRLMGELMAELKALGRYDDAMIVFHSDHGTGSVGSTELAGHEVDPVQARRFLAQGEQWRYTPSQVLNSTESMLLVKPPHSKAELEVVSDRLTQLADIPATIFDAIGLTADAGVGHSVLSEDFPAPREVHVYRGFSQANEFGVNVRYGVRLFKGEANHLTYSQERGWRVHENIRVEW